MRAPSANAWPMRLSASGASGIDTTRAPSANAWPMRLSASGASGIDATRAPSANAWPMRLGASGASGIDTTRAPSANAWPMRLGASGASGIDTTRAPCANAWLARLGASGASGIDATRAPSANAWLARLGASGASRIDTTRAPLATALAPLVVLATLGACAPRPDPPVSVEGGSGFTNFETEPVAPLALAADGEHLFALNTADDRLEILRPTRQGLASVSEIAVGLRPVALALRDRDREVWVANHLSDSVSVVDVSTPSRPRLRRTLSVGDEPRGIVAAGPGKRRVFVATARRDRTLEPGLGRALVWVFDGEDPAAPPRVLTLFGAKPRALAASADGRRVYAAVFRSGNRTASASAEAARRLGRAPAVDELDVEPAAEPKKGAIVRQTSDGWLDFAGRDWSRAIPFDLPDHDLFVIDASGASPTVVERVSGVGTVLFNLAERPGTNEIWVTNTEAHNLVPHEPRLRGAFADNRLTRVVPEAGGARVESIPLRSGARSVAPSEGAPGLAQPLDIVFDAEGERAYVAAFGSRAVAVLDEDLEIVERFEVGFGPAGLAYDAGRRRLYVLNHLDASISVVDLASGRAVSTVALRHDPTPPVVKAGRPFLYDAALASADGRLSCATCHVFGDRDGLAWDLGTPGGRIGRLPPALGNEVLAVRPRQALHPSKGPMTTQSLRGLPGTAPLHWRGDRFGSRLRPGDDLASFKDFNATFVDLLGRDSPLPEPAMEAFARFVHTIRYPPNPNQPLDRGMSAEAEAGFEFFTGAFRSDRGVLGCADCHRLPLGTNRRVNFEGAELGRDMKTPHLRNVYDKVGRFDAPGPQVSGFGLVHDGSVGTVVDFLRLDVFAFPGATEAERGAMRRALNAYVLAFDTGMAPAVGRQVTLSARPGPDERALLETLAERAQAGDCDLLARSWVEGEERGWLLRGGAFHGNRTADAPRSLEDLLAHARARDEPLTFTCVPPGDGVRSALDRDLDGHLDGDERDAGSDPASAASRPAEGQIPS